MAIGCNPILVEKRTETRWRICNDIDRYGHTLTGWKQVMERFRSAPLWCRYAVPTTGWNDFDSLDIGNGAMDGLTDSERQTVMTLWAMECSPLYPGDDLTKLDSYGLKLLTNKEVIAIDQAGRVAQPLRSGTLQVWSIQNPDKSQFVALFNLDGANTLEGRLNWNELGLPSSVRVRDIWAQKDLGVFPKGFSASLAPHACLLLRLCPAASSKGRA